LLFPYTTLSRSPCTPCATRRKSHPCGSCSRCYWPGAPPAWCSWCSGGGWAGTSSLVRLLSRDRIQHHPIGASAGEPGDPLMDLPPQDAHSDPLGQRGQPAWPAPEVVLPHGAGIPLAGAGETPPAGHHLEEPRPGDHPHAGVRRRGEGHVFADHPDAAAMHRQRAHPLGRGGRVIEKLLPSHERVPPQPGCASGLGDRESFFRWQGHRRLCLNTGHGPILPWTTAELTVAMSARSRAGPIRRPGRRKSARSRPLRRNLVAAAATVADTREGRCPKRMPMISAIHASSVPLHHTIAPAPPRSRVRHLPTTTLRTPATLPPATPMPTPRLAPTRPAPPPPLGTPPPISTAPRARLTRTPPPWPSPWRAWACAAARAGPSATWTCRPASATWSPSPAPPAAAAPHCC